MYIDLHYDASNYYFEIIINIFQAIPQVISKKSG